MCNLNDAIMISAMLLLLSSLSPPLRSSLPLSPCRPLPGGATGGGEGSQGGGHRGSAQFTGGGVAEPTPGAGFN